MKSLRRNPRKVIDKYFSELVTTSSLAIHPMMGGRPDNDYQDQNDKLLQKRLKNNPDLKNNIGGVK